MIAVLILEHEPCAAADCLCDALRQVESIADALEVRETLMRQPHGHA